MHRLWGKFWFRLVVSAITAPTVLCFSVLVSVFLLQLLLGYGAGFPYVSGRLFTVLMIGAAVMSLPLWIAMEIFNRGCCRPLPPGLAVVYLLAFGAVITACLTALSELDDPLMELGLPVSALTPYLALAGIYVVAVIVTTALLSPVIMRWKRRTATADEFSGMF